jgi:predicted nucleic acid-binding protein
MMMSNIKELFLDTNILIYYTNPQLPQHSLAVQSVDTAYQSGIELLVSPQVLREYLAANTKFIKNNPQLTHEKIRANFQTFLNQFRVLDDNRQVLNTLNNLLKTVTVAGRHIYDANLVATMQNYGIQYLLTNNPADFTAFSSIITVLPLSPTV